MRGMRVKHCCVEYQRDCVTLLFENVTAMPWAYSAVFQNIRKLKLAPTDSASSGDGAAEQRSDNFVIHSALLVNAVASLFRRRVPLVISPLKFATRLSRRQPYFVLGETRGRTWRYSRCYLLFPTTVVGRYDRSVFSSRFRQPWTRIDGTKGGRRPHPVPEIA